MPPPHTPYDPPPHGRFSHFIHLYAGAYMNYRAAIERAARQDHGAVDIDIQASVEGTMWCLHWATVGKNHLRDRSGKIPPWARIENLTDAEIASLRSATNKHPHTFRRMAVLAAGLDVRVEGELKTHVHRDVLHDLMSEPAVAAMHKRGLIQIKTLANFGRPVHRLRPAHEVGFTTLLTFTNYHGPGIDASLAWPVTDFVRGNPKWTNVPHRG